MINIKTQRKTIANHRRTQKTQKHATQHAHIKNNNRQPQKQLHKTHKHKPHKYSKRVATKKQTRTVNNKNRHSCLERKKNNIFAEIDPDIKTFYEIQIKYYLSKIDQEQNTFSGRRCLPAQVLYPWTGPGQPPV